jgi:hypothetical protein
MRISCAIPCGYDKGVAFFPKRFAKACIVTPYDGKAAAVFAAEMEKLSAGNGRAVLRRRRGFGEPHCAIMLGLGGFPQIVSRILLLLNLCSLLVKFGSLFVAKRFFGRK